MGKMREFEDSIKDGGRNGPRTEVCYICGREFGSASIGIHEKQCAKKWEDIEAQKPERERKPLPLRPHVHDGASREQRNKAAKAVHEAEAMAHCACGRTFKDEETMRRHQKTCNVVGSYHGNGAGLPNDGSSAPRSCDSESHLNACPNCGRNFSPESLEIHLRSCGGGHGVSKPSRSTLDGGTRKERDAAESIHLLLQVSSRDPKLSAQMRATFTKLDINGNGALEKEEFQTVYRAVKIPPPKPSLDELMSQYDANHDGKLQFAEFERLITWVLTK